MRKVVLIGAALALFVGGTATGILLQAYMPLIKQRGKEAGIGLPAAPVQQVTEPMTLTGDLGTVVKGTEEYEVYYERPFASPPALTFTNPARTRVQFKLTEQRANGFKISVYGHNPPDRVPEVEYQYPRWEAKGLPAPGK